MSHANFAAFLDSWSIELSAQSNRVRNLIGDVHWLSDGNHKEAVIRAFLKRYLSTAIVVGTGFAVNPADDRGVTRQIDILVCDFKDQTPFLVEGDLLIVAGSSVAAHIEVKSRLTSSTLSEALGNIIENEAIIGEAKNPPWRGLVFYSSEEYEEVRFKDWVASRLASSGATLLAQQVSPMCIVGVGKFIAFVDEIGIGSARLRLLSTGEKSLAFGMLDLISSVRYRAGGNNVAPIDVFAQSTLSLIPKVYRMEF